MQALWGDALLRVEEGLNAGRRWLWDEASRKAGTLIAAPSAFQGEHFLQVYPFPIRPKTWHHVAVAGATKNSQPSQIPCMACNLAWHLGCWEVSGSP